MYNKLAIFVDAFIRDPRSEEIFLRNLLQIKKLNLPILLLSNTTISKKIQDEVNYFVYDSVDLKFQKTYENYEMLAHFIQFENFRIEFNKLYTQPYGLSVMSNHYKCISILNSLGYDAVIKLEWDIFYDNRDLDSIKNFIVDFKNGIYNKGYFQCGNPPAWITRGTCVEGFIWAVDTKFFLENFPKLLCEDDYDSYLTNVVKDRSFLTDARFLYKTLVEKFKNYGTVKTDPSLCEIKHSYATELSPVNYPHPCSKTTIRYLFKTLNENKYVLFTKNLSYINEQNPNWATVNYRIKTKTQSINIVHNVNSDCYQYNDINISPNEFPIELSVENETVTYNTRDEIIGIFLT